jgi:hypothetical protein
LPGELPVQRVSKGALGSGAVCVSGRYAKLRAVKVSREILCRGSYTTPPVRGPPCEPKVRSISSMSASRSAIWDRLCWLRRLSSQTSKTPKAPVATVTQIYRGHTHAGRSFVAPIGIIENPADPAIPKQMEYQTERLGCGSLHRNKFRRILAQSKRRMATLASVAGAGTSMRVLWFQLIGSPPEGSPISSLSALLAAIAGKGQQPTR